MGELSAETIADVADPRLERFARVRDKDLLREDGLFVAESREVVRALLDSSFETVAILTTQTALSALSEHLERLATTPAVYVASADDVAEIVGFPFHRGCLALGRRPAPEPIERWLTARAASGFVVGLHAVTNPDNVGSIFRSAAAFGAQGVVVAGGTVDPLYRKATRTSMGATLSLPFAATTWPDAFTAFDRHGYSFAVMTPDGEVDLRDLGSTRPLPERLVLCFGNEGAGVSQELADAAQMRVRIPMAAGVDSVNVGVAAGIALQHVFAQRA